MRIGAVSYLNTKPLVFGLSELAPQHELVFDLPSRLADRLAAGQLDVAFAQMLANVRVGLEDNLYVGKGQLATNAQLVDKAVNIIESMGARVIGPAEVREKLKLTKRAPRG